MKAIPSVFKTRSEKATTTAKGCKGDKTGLAGSLTNSPAVHPIDQKSSFLHLNAAANKGHPIHDSHGAPLPSPLRSTHKVTGDTVDG